MELYHYSTILTQTSDQLRSDMAKYLPLTMFAHNMFNTPNLGNYSPYEFNLW